MSLRVVQGKGKKDRVLPVSTRLGAILSAYLAERARLGKTGPYFFASAQYDTPMPPKSIDIFMRRIRAAVGFHFSSHVLRHTFATLMLEGGCDIYALSLMMGHEKITTTTIYLACSPRMLAGSMEKHPLN